MNFRQVFLATIIFVSLIADGTEVLQVGEFSQSIRSARDQGNMALADTLTNEY